MVGKCECAVFCAGHSPLLTPFCVDAHFRSNQKGQIAHRCQQGGSVCDNAAWCTRTLMGIHLPANCTSTLPHDRVVSIKQVPSCRRSPTTPNSSQYILYRLYCLCLHNNGSMSICSKMDEDANGATEQGRAWSDSNKGRDGWETHRDDEGGTWSQYPPSNNSKGGQDVQEHSRLEYHAICDHRSTLRKGINTRPILPV